MTYNVDYYSQEDQSEDNTYGFYEEYVEKNSEAQNEETGTVEDEAVASENGETETVELQIFGRDDVESESNESEDPLHIFDQYYDSDDEPAEEVSEDQEETEEEPETEEEDVDYAFEVIDDEGNAVSVDAEDMGSYHNRVADDSLYDVGMYAYFGAVDGALEEVQHDDVESAMSIDNVESAMSFDDYYESEWEHYDR